MRASSVPLLEDEPLVVIRASFLALCDGDHCAAALLNNFVYWHDWCVTYARYDAVASDADPEHQASDPERWFWKTTETLVNDDLLRLWGEKKVRAAIDLLEEKGYAQSRSNPKNAYDRTKQYRLVPDRLAADLQRWASTQERERCATAEMPSRSGKNAECTASRTYGDSRIRPKCRMQSAKLPTLKTETTNSEITNGISPSSSYFAELHYEVAGTREEESKLRPEQDDVRERQTGAGTELNGIACLILEWASDRHVRRRRDDRSYGQPDDHRFARWGLYCLERSITSVPSHLSIYN